MEEHKNFFKPKKDAVIRIFPVVKYIKNPPLFFIHCGSKKDFKNEKCIIEETFKAIDQIDQQIKEILG